MVATSRISFTPQAQAPTSESKDWQKIRHYEYPDYNQPLLEIPTAAKERICQRLGFL